MSKAKTNKAGRGAPASGLTAGEVLTSALSSDLPSGGGASNSGFMLLAATATLTGNNSVNLLTGGAPDEVILALNGNDTLWGLAGDDTLFGGNGNDLAYGGDAADSLFGESGNDALLGEAGDDSLYGGNGTDTAYGGLGADSLDGGSADDSLIGGSGHDWIDGGAGSGADRLWGESGNDQLYGGNSGDRIYGGDGNDLVSGGSGADSLYGGTGQDTLDYSDSSAAVDVKLNDGSAESGGEAAGDVTDGFEHIVGSSFADVLQGHTGNSAVSTLWGLAGNDKLYGLSGDDRFYGGAGNDTIFTDDGDDTVDPGDGDDTIYGTAGNDYFFGSPGADRYDDAYGSDLIDYADSPAAIAVITSASVAEGFGGWAEGDTFTGDNAFNAVIGSNFDDTIHGYQADESPWLNTFFGGLGDDTLMPNSSGFDSLYGGDGGDWASWADVNAPVKASLATGQGIMGSDVALLAQIEHLLGSQANDTLAGDAGDNKLRGQDGLDSLVGGSGADSLFGEGGDDVLFFDAADLAVIGGSGRDTLVGTNGSDSVQLDGTRFQHGSGYAGIEVYDLGLGNDYFLGSDSLRNPAFAEYQGSGLSVFGGSGVDYITMRGTGASMALNDYVEAGSGNDYIWGGWGNDTIFGGAGVDNSYGGIGNDTIYSGGGFDLHYIGCGEGDDTIYGGSGADADGLVLYWGNNAQALYDGVDPSEIDLQYSGANVIITFDDGGSVTFAKGEVAVLNLFDFGHGGTGVAPPGKYDRDVWSAEWDAGSQTFSAFTLAVDG